MKMQRPLAARRRPRPPDPRRRINPRAWAPARPLLGQAAETVAKAAVPPAVAAAARRMDQPDREAGGAHSSNSD